MKDLFNWYIQDGLLCGDLCLVNMRQIQYRLEKNTYKDPIFIQKQDKRYKKTYPCHYRFHLFVKLEIVCINENMATVIYDKQKQNIVLQNMDSLFFFNEVRKKNIEQRYQEICKLTLK